MTRVYRNMPRPAYRRSRVQRRPFAAATLEQAQVGSLTNSSHHLVVCDHAGHFLEQVHPSRISELLHEADRFIWFDVQDPRDEDIELLREEFSFHPLALEDAARAPRLERPKLDVYDGYYFVVFYGISFQHETNRLITQPLGLFIGATYLVTIHDGPMPAVAETISRWQRNHTEYGNDVGSLLYALLDTIVDEYFPVIDALAERVEIIEERIFERFDPNALQEVFALKRDLLAIRRMVAPERDVLNVLIRREVPIFDRNTIIYLQDVYDHIVRVSDSIDTYRDLLSSALDAFLSVQSNQLNQIVKVLTLASIILMSASLIAGIYGMNFEYMPELSWPFGYPLALGMMLLVGVGLLLYFRWRKWL